jgi:hypothetical protein
MNRIKLSCVAVAFILSSHAFAVADEFEEFREPINFQAKIPTKLLGTVPVNYDIWVRNSSPSASPQLRVYGNQTFHCSEWMRFELFMMSTLSVSSPSFQEKLFTNLGAAIFSNTYAVKNESSKCISNLPASSDQDLWISQSSGRNHLKIGQDANGNELTLDLMIPEMKARGTIVRSGDFYEIQNTSLSIDNSFNAKYRIYYIDYPQDDEVEVETGSVEFQSAVK